MCSAEPAWQGSERGVTRESTSATLAIQALCNRQSDKLLEKLLPLDAFMASRFSNHSTTRAATSTETPRSTEPNTPWMLADIVLSSVKTQQRADSMRRIRGEAQVDLLLCSDSNCTVLADVVKVEKGDARSRWSFITSGIATSTFQTSVGTVAGLGTNRLIEQRGMLPQELMQGSDDDTSVFEVVWQAKAATVVLNDTSCGSTPMAGYLLQGLLRKPAHVLPYSAQAVLASVQKAPWQSMLVGHYKVSDAQFPTPSGVHQRDKPYVRPSYMWDASANPADVLGPQRGSCITVIWPNHPWMHEHGWGGSDADCERAFESAAADACVNNTLPVAVFDSMFTQAHLLNGANVTHTLEQLATEWLAANATWGGMGSTGYMNFSSVALLLPYAHSIADRVVFPRRMRQGASRLASTYNSMASRFGLTLDKHMLVSTQRETGCISPCPAKAWSLHSVAASEGPVRHCGSCALLNLGSANVAAVPAHAFEVDHTGRTQYDIQGQLRVAQALHSVLFHSVQGDVVTSLPWCGLGMVSEGYEVSREALAGVAGQYLSVLMQNVSSLGDGRFKTSEVKGVIINTMPLSLNVGNEESVLLTLHSFVNASIVQNCSFWHSLGIGFVAGPNKRATKRPPASIAHYSFVTVWPLELVDTHDSSQALVGPGLGGVGAIVDKSLQPAISSLTADAARLLDQQVAQELATTDGTKTWLGALWDMSVVILGIVAMACGRADTEAWMSRQLDRFWDNCGPRNARGRPDGRRFVVVCLAKVLYCCVVVLALVMAPAVVIASEVAAREQNVSGSSSKVGWLAVDLLPSDIPMGSNTHYVLVGAVTIRNVALYDQAAQVLLLVNVVLSVLGTLCIWASSYFRFATDYDAHRMSARLPN